jgi:hypothetical protein
MSYRLLTHCHATFDDGYRHAAVAALDIENRTHGAHARKGCLHDERTAGALRDMKQSLAMIQRDETLVRAVTDDELAPRREIHYATVREGDLTSLTQLGCEDGWASP